MRLIRNLLSHLKLTYMYLAPDIAVSGATILYAQNAKQQVYQAHRRYGMKSGEIERERDRK